MKKKKSVANSMLIAMALCGLSFISCGGSGGETFVEESLEQVTDFQLNISESSISVDFEASEHQIQLTACTNWIATTTASWIHITPAYGKTSASVVVSIDSNTGTEDRDADITFKNDKNSVTLHVSQSKQVTDFQLNISESSISVDFEASEHQIQLTTSTNWIATTTASWIHITPAYGKTSTSVVVSIDSNTGAEDRDADITFKNDKNSVTLHVSQSKYVIKPKIGDYLYSDGTWSSQLDYEKTPLGIVFSTETTEKDKALGYKRGYAMTIAPPSMQYSYGVSWSTVSKKEFSDSYTTIQEALNDRDGLTKTMQIAQTDDYKNKYPAFYKAYNFLEDFYPEWTSPRFLPSAGQWRDIIVNLGEASSEYDFISEGGDVIWEVSTSIVNKINSYLEPCREHPTYIGFKALPGIYWYFKSGFYHCSTELSSTKAIVMHFALNEGWYLKGISYPVYYYFTRIGGLNKTSSMDTGHVRPCFAF